MDLLRYQRSMDYSNSTNTYNGYDYNYDGRDTILEVKFQDLIHTIFAVLTSTIGIAFFIFILTKKELRNNPTCWLVINVLVAALVQGFVVLPVDVYTTYIRGSWSTGLVGCFISKILNNVNYIHIQFSILLLMIDRFVYFSKHSSHPDIMTPKIVRIAIVCSVVCEVVLSVISVAVNRPHVEETPDSAVCMFGYTNDAWIVLVSLSVFLPAVVIILFGLVTFVCTLVMCHKLNEGNSQERSKKKQAVALNIVVGLLNVICFFFGTVLTGISLSSYRYNIYLWDILDLVYNTFYLVLPILVMVLIPEIRSEMACCKNAKKGEKTPLI